ncbi:hypothetical protein [Verrucomicrobium sp. BvORR106]|uniref:hypothetical protein n=1 Tax=Verrucomicrobium sp. BvORR106 TaxID=1403819 RepID=UPI00056EDF9D|nr:hypothetical protein [Verrucomicrobium sp. BvORR106]
MKPIFRLTLLLVGTGLSGLLVAQEANEYRDYLAHSTRLPVYVEVAQDEILRFETDVTGDGAPEVLFTKSSLRDGKLGYLWSIYKGKAGGGLRLLGDVTFPEKVLTPSAWKQDSGKYGFYTFFPSGASQGTLTFFEVGDTGVVERESRKISPNSTDKVEFDSLFAARLTGAVPAIEPKRIPVSTVMAAPVEVPKAPALESAQAPPAPEKK